MSVLGPVAVAWSLQGRAVVERPRAAAATRSILLAIGVGWLLAFAFWVPLGILLAL